MYRCLRTIRSNSPSNRGGGKDMMEKKRRTNTSIGNTVDIVKRDKDDENYDIVFNVADLTHLCIPGTRRMLDSTLAKYIQMILLAGRERNLK
eukprot:scaffold9789_cov138-Chaetoceros_neogracile.AAC.1